MAKASKSKPDISSLLSSARYFMHALMAKVFFANLDKKQQAALISTAYTVAQAFTEAKADPAVADTAEQFLHGILQKENFEQLDAKRINSLVADAIELATDFHKHT